MFGKRLITPVRHARLPVVYPTRCNTKRRAGRALDDENPLTFVRELFGSTGDDPGHWNFSPEWWGTQNNGWGRDSGEAVFCGNSVHGNGKVTVTAHSCSSQEGPAGSVQQWRVLRFNDVTRQSVAKVTIAHHTRSAPINSSSQTAPVAGSRQGKGTDTSSEEAAPEVRADSPFGGLAGSAARSTSSTPGRQAGGGYLNDQDSHRPPEPEWTIVQQADCLAPEYLKSMASLAAAIIGMQGLLSRAGTLSDAENQMRVPISMRGEGGEGEPPLRILCIGLGGGSLPLFLAHHFPKALVDAVELDPVVVAAATQAMGLPTARPNLRLHTQDAREYVARFVASRQQQQRGRGAHGEEGAEGQPYSLVFLDAFDGEDNVPEELCSEGFARDLALALHPQWGTLILNMHALPSVRTPPFALKLGRRTLPPEAGYDPETSTGALILSVAGVFGRAMRGSGIEPGAAPVCSSGVTRGSSTEREAVRGGQDGQEAAGAHVSTDDDVRIFTVGVQRQLNVQVVVSRGLPLEDDVRKSAARLKAVSSFVADEAGYRFPTGRRSCRGFFELGKEH